MPQEPTNITLKTYSEVEIQTDTVPVEEPINVETNDQDIQVDEIAESEPTKEVISLPEETKDEDLLNELSPPALSEPKVKNFMKLLDSSGLS